MKGGPERWTRRSQEAALRGPIQGALQIRIPAANEMGEIFAIFSVFLDVGTLGMLFTAVARASLRHPSEDREAGVTAKVTMHRISYEDDSRL